MIPLIYRGAGIFATTSGYHAKACDKKYGEGEIRDFEEVGSRSAASHNHYFARIHDLWQTLPEHLAEEFPSDEHLRKWALIKAGYATMFKLVLTSPELAIDAAQLVTEMDSYAVVEVQSQVVTVWRAKSQSLKAMKTAAEFERSKSDVLDVIHRLIDADDPE